MAFETKKAAQEAVAEAKTSKNRAKRLKRKGGSAATKLAPGSEDTSNNSVGADGVKRKKGMGLGGGSSGIKFKRPGEESDDEAESEPVVPSAPEPEVELESEVQAVSNEGGGITIVDDDE